MSTEEQNRLIVLFHAYDEDNSGRIEKNEFCIICQELNIPSHEIDRLFKRLDIDGDGTVTLEEFISGFKDQHLEGEDDRSSSISEGELSDNEQQVISR